MKKFLFLIALFTLMGGAKAEDEITQIAISGTTDNMTVECLDANLDPLDPQPATPQYPAKFTPTSDFKRIFQYTNFEVGDNDAIVVEFGGEVPEGWNINGYVNGQNAAQSFESIKGYGTTEKPKYVMNLSGLSGNIVDFTIFNWAGCRNPIIVKDVYFIKYDDPLADEKAALQTAINKGNAQNSFAKTTESWNALRTAITTGESVLENSNDAGVLTSATEAINDAINGFVLQDGYTKLTKEMANNNVDYVLNSSTGLAYGTGGVDMNTYAELNEFDQFIVLASVGKPRFCMNRKTADGQIGVDKANSNMIDINTQGEYAAYTWATDKYQTIDGNKYTVDLNLIAADWNGLAKLHCIKGANYSNVTVTDMLLYRTINVGATGYATFGSLYKNAKPKGVTAYAAKYVDGQVTLNPVTNVPAGKGVVIMGGAGSYAPTFDVAADNIDSDLKVSNGTVVGDGSTIYVLNKVADKVGFYLLKAGNTLEAGKAYLKIEDGVAKARAFIGISGMDVTGISTVKQAEGKKDDVIYNLNGQRVSNPRKGLFIKNGVKFLVD